MPGSSSASAAKGFLAGVERVAVRAFDAAHALFLEHAIEFAAGAAIAVEAEDLVVGRTVGADLRPHRFRNALGMVVQLRGQTGKVDMLEPERQHFTRQGAAGDDEDFARAVAAAREARLGEEVGVSEVHVMSREVSLEALEYAPVNRVVARCGDRGCLLGVEP